MLLAGCQGYIDDRPIDSAAMDQDVLEQASLATRAGAPTGPSNWALVAAESYLSFITVKQTDIAEVSSFERFDVQVGVDGNALVNIDLASVATGIDLRDQRVRDYLFEVVSFPAANVSLAFDIAAASAIAVGAKATMPTSATVSLHGLSVAVATDLEVMRMTADKVVVMPKKPIVLHAADFNMTAGIAYLVELAGLQSISSAVPVDFMFTLAVVPAAAPL
jgi:polyisoprenoid-binding protein YceI